MFIAHYYLSHPRNGIKNFVFSRTPSQRHHTAPVKWAKNINCCIYCPYLRLVRRQCFQLCVSLRNMVQGPPNFRHQKSEDPNTIHPGKRAIHKTSHHGITPSKWKRHQYASKHKASSNGHCTVTGSGQVQRNGSNESKYAVQKCLHRTEAGKGTIVSYCACPVSCPDPVPIQCERNQDPLFPIKLLLVPVLVPCCRAVWICHERVVGLWMKGFLVLSNDTNKNLDVCIKYSLSKSSGLRHTEIVPPIDLSSNVLS